MRVRLNHQRLREVLARSPRSQNHWALIIGLSRGHLSDLVNGTHPYPSAKTREKLLEALDVNFDDLFTIETEGDEWSQASSARFQAALAQTYAIDHEVARGGMGSVYLARDVKLGRTVAIKVVSPEVVRQVGTVPFHQEIRLTAQLHHPNILTLLDAGEAAGYAYYVTPYVADGSLRERLDQSPRLPVADVVRITEGLVAGLVYAHQRRIVHCDIKPENILLPNGHPLLADFGISQVVRAEFAALRRRAEVAGVSAGTPAYISPEQAAGEESLDGRSDLFSLACVVFEMLAGEPPFAGDSLEEIVAGRFRPVPPRLVDIAPDVPRAVSEVLERAMAPDPRERYVDVSAFGRDLGAAAEGGPSVGRRVRWSRTADRTRALAAAWARGTVGRSPVLSQMGRDLAYALRALRQRPTVSLLLILTLAIGIGLNTAMFSVVSTVLLRPLPYPHPGALVSIAESQRGTEGRSRLTYPNFVDLRREGRSFTGVAAYFGGEQPVGGGAVPTRAPVYGVSGDFFPVLGVGPRLGAITRPAPGEPPSRAVLSDALWRASFGGDPDVIGKTLLVDGSPMTIVAVMPPGFSFPRRAAAWLPTDLSTVFGDSRTAHNLGVVARRDPGASLGSAQAEADALGRRLAAQFPDELSDRFTFSVQSLHEVLVGSARQTLVLLLAVVGVVFLIACGNMASILSAQAVGRGKEMAVRLAVGANAGRLVRQLLTESAVIGLVGAAGGLALAGAALGALNRLVPAEYLHSGPVRLDWRVIAFTLVLGLVAAALFGAAPAWRATRVAPNDALRADGAVVRTVGRQRWGGVFVVPQYAFSLAAIVVAAMILRSLFLLSEVDPGFDPRPLVTVDIDLPSGASSPYASRESVLRFQDQLLARAKALPGVRAATLDLAPPFSSTFRVNGAAAREGGTWEDGAYPDWRVVGPEYFATTGIRLTRGRDFTAADGPGGIPVAIVSQSLARQLWGGESPIGKRLRLSSLDYNRAEAERYLTVIGVAEDVRSRGLDDDARPAVYAPAAQHLDRARWADLVVASSGNPAGLVPQLRGLLQSIDPGLPIGRVETMEGWVRETLAAPRFRAGLVAGFGGVALLLALLGVYGVMSYTVSRRRRDTAVRVALGAGRPDIVREFLRMGLRYILVGQVLGVLVALAFARLLQGLLFEVATVSVPLIAAVSLALAGVVVATCYLPARRAARVDPLVALKG